MSLPIHIPRELVGSIQVKDTIGQDRNNKRPAQQDRRPSAKRPREEGRGRVSSLSEEDWEERELDEDIFKKVCI